ncbi:MAG: YhfC family intramembrane metalloprotease [Oscillospiraceae bacterium]|nr:YhfC family intramembrane metalloprotease [Oscillospiraceae bacterium]
MRGQVSLPTALCVTISGIGCAAATIASALVLRRRYHARRLPFWVGGGVMLLFSIGLGAALRWLLLTTAAGRAVASSVWLYAACIGLTAGVSEELGRFAAVRTALRRCADRVPNALMLGLGHGAAEMSALFLLILIQRLGRFSVVGAGQDAILLLGASQQLAGWLELLPVSQQSISPEVYLWIGLEQLSATAVHMALSVIVWAAAASGHPGRRRRYLSLAILLHTAIDAISVLLLHYGMSIRVLEFNLMLFACLCMVFAYAIWSTLPAHTNRYALALLPSGGSVYLPPPPEVREAENQNHL